MRKINPQDNQARQIVKKFCNYVVQLKSIYRTFKALFEDQEAKKLMEQTAKAFFLDINKILIKYLLLEIAKITDPFANTHKKKENFTIENIIQTIDWQKTESDKLAELNKFISDFRNLYIIPVRHELLAHYDKKVFLSDTVLGAFPQGEDEKLMDALEEMCNVLHKACFGKIFGEIVVTMPGDVFDLKKALKRGIAFDKLFIASKGEELMKLVKYLDEVP